MNEWKTLFMCQKEVAWNRYLYFWRKRNSRSRGPYCKPKCLIVLSYTTFIWRSHTDRRHSLTYLASSWSWTDSGVVAVSDDTLLCQWNDKYRSIMRRIDLVCPPRSSLKPRLLGITGSVTECHVIYVKVEQSSLISNGRQVVTSIDEKFAENPVYGCEDISKLKFLPEIAFIYKKVMNEKW